MCFKRFNPDLTVSFGQNAFSQQYLCFLQISTKMKNMLLGDKINKQVFINKFVYYNKEQQNRYILETVDVLDIMKFFP